MKSFIDYEYYQTSFPGIEIPEEEFNRLVLRASLFVKDITFGRVCEEAIPEEVKDAVCAVCDALYREEKILAKTCGRSVKSENTDGHDVTFADEGKSGQIHEAVLWDKMYVAARPYLLPLGLLYRG